MGASPDGLVIHPGEQHQQGLVEIKCSARAEKTSLLDLCTNEKYKSSFCLRYNNDNYVLCTMDNNSNNRQPLFYGHQQRQ